MKHTIQCLLAGIILTGSLSAQAGGLDLFSSINNGPFSNVSRPVATSDFITLSLQDTGAGLLGMPVAIAADLVPCGYQLCVDLDGISQTCDLALGSELFFLIAPSLNPLSPRLTPWGVQISIQLPDVQGIFDGPDNEVLRVQGAALDPTAPMLIAITPYIDHHVETITLFGPGQDNASRAVDLVGGFPFYGVPRTSLWVSTNGSMTFGSPDSDSTPTASEFLSGSARIAPCWSDLDPSLSAGGLVTSFKRACGGNFTSIEVAYNAVSAAGAASDENTFSTTLYPNGDITMTWGALSPSATTDIVGLSPGFNQSNALPLDLTNAIGLSSGAFGAFYQVGDETNCFDTIRDLQGLSLTFQLNNSTNSYTLMNTGGLPHLAVAASPEQGPAAGGTLVTIDGFRFSATNTYTVDFGGLGTVPATVVDACTLTCTSPAAALGPVLLTVNETSGTGDISTISTPFTFQ